MNIGPHVFPLPLTYIPLGTCPDAVALDYMAVLIFEIIDNTEWMSHTRGGSERNGIPMNQQISYDICSSKSLCLRVR
jgi:hypothetical protein